MEPNQAWIGKLGELHHAGTPCVMVVVTDVKGSAPREAGTRMLVAEGRLVWGTIGGGNLEHLAIEEATRIVEAGTSEPKSEDYPLAEKTGQCCGGQVTLFYEPFRWTRRTIAIFGAGHVGQALGNLAPWLEARVQLIDGRMEEELVPPLSSGSPGSPGSSGKPELPFELICIDAPEGEVDSLPPDALVLIMTHSHELDFEILRRALDRGTFPYVGLIGSARKWQRFRARLAERGFSAETIDSVHCPIGLSQASKEPAAIALSTAAQLAEVMARAAY